MSEEFLNRPDIITILEKMGRKGMAKDRTGDAFSDGGIASRLFYSALEATGDSMWGRRPFPLRGSTARFEAEKRYCEANSPAALGNFVSSA